MIIMKLLMTLMKIVHINIFSEDNSDENSNTINENGNNEVMVIMK